MIFALIVMSLIGSAFFYDRRVEIQKVEAQQKIEDRQQALFDTLSLGAKAVYVAPLHGAPLYAVNENTKLPLASLTKIMTAVAALDIAPSVFTITIPKKALLEEGDNGLLVGEKWQLSTLIKFMLVVSSNDAAKAISLNMDTLLKEGTEPWHGARSFVDGMNIRAKELGLVNMEFQNESGLDINTTESGSEGSASDFARLFAYGFEKYPEIFSATREEKITVKSLNDVSHTVKNTDTLLALDPDIVASKTGTTDLAGGNLAVIANIQGKDYVIVVLGSSISGRFDDVETVLNALRKYLVPISQTPALPLETVN